MTVEDSNQHKRAIYIDTESTFWAGPPPPGLTYEIIEVGIVEMDLTTLQLCREQSYFVRPKRWEVSARCTKLTGITSDNIRTAATFPEVVAKFTKEFSPETALCCTWGDDAKLIAATCHKHGLRMPLRNVLDLAPLFQSLFLLRQMAGLQNAVKMLDLTFDGVPHGALPDARNTALVHAAVLRRMRGEFGPAPSIPEAMEESSSVTSFGEKLLAALERQNRATPAMKIDARRVGSIQ